MDFKVLVDNSDGQEVRLEAEHGLSFYFEMDGQKWLLDVGASDLFARNAEVMGIDIASVDHLVLSHAHADHTGGLSTFLQLNNHAQIWLSSHIDGRHFFSTRRGTRRDISIDYSLLSAFPDRFHFVGENRRLTSSVALLVDIPAIYPCPMANRTLYADQELDDFSHELAVIIKENEAEKQEFSILSSCSHKGILNTLLGAKNWVESGAFQEKVPLSRVWKAYVGGLHLVESDADHQFETEADITDLANQLSCLCPDLKVYTGHCTGQTALKVLKNCLGNRLIHFKTGFDSIVILSSGI